VTSPASGPENDRLVIELARVVGDAHVLVEPDLRAPYEHDFTGRYGAASRAVVRPADGREVAQVLRLCSDHDADVVPQGGNTGVVGGGVPRGGEVIVSTRRLAEVGPVDEMTGQLLVGAGATLATVQTAALRAGWEMPLDLGARDGATIGGLVATDAGGAMALAQGTMRRRVAGLAAVLPDGRVVKRLGGLLKDNAGYAWPSLMVGSEGTLGIITSVLVRLVPRRASRVAALFAVAGAADAMQLLVTLRRLVPALEACDVFFDDGVALAERVLDDVRLPLQQRAPCYVVVECAGATDPTPDLAEAAEAADDLILDQAAADDTARRRELWQVREALPEALVRAGVPVKVDVAVPLNAVARFSDEVPAVVERAAPGAETVLWGHLGDGNVHVNVLGAQDASAAVEEHVLRLAAELGGTVSAEHGVGVSKARHLGLVRSSEELELMQALKTAVDPAGVMNPGVIFQRLRRSAAHLVA
jgi:FAD/FMN-containing dehydrogenase